MMSTSIQYPYLELNRSSAKFRQNCHSRRIRRIRQNHHFVGTPISSSIALRRNSSKSPFSPNSPDSSKSPLHRYPYLVLNCSLAKFRQNCHSRQICRIRQNRHFVGTPISSSIALRHNFVKIAIFPLILIFGEISSKLPNSPLRAFLDISRFHGNFLKSWTISHFIEKGFP